MATPAAVIFDNDGLLLDTESVWTRGEEILFERRGQRFTLEHKRELVGTSAHTAGTTLARQLGETGTEAELIIELDEIVFAELDNGVEPMTGALELVAELRERSIPIGLASNSPARFIARTLELVALTGEFAAVVSGHDVPAPKPAPDVYLEACQQLGVEPGPGVAVLEDSPTGIAAGRAAGLTVYGVPSLDGVALDGAHRVFGSLAEPALRGSLGL